MMLNSIIKSRRTTKPAHFNGEHITEDQVMALLHAADWAPTHKFTEPWRFIVFSPNRVPGFCFEHAALYKAHTPEAEFEQSKFDKLLHLGDKSSHIIIVYTKLTSGNRLPVWEEMAATACAIQNLLLSAHEAGIATFWSTGGMSAKPQFKTWLNLDENDVPMAMLYLGRSNEVPIGVRRIPVQDKVRWER